MKFSKPVFIVNKHSGRFESYGSVMINGLENYFAEEKIDTHQYHTQKQRDVSGILQCVNSLTPDLLIIVGGDGTVNDVINALYDQPSPTLLVIPAGSGNDLCRSLWGKLDVGIEDLIAAFHSDPITIDTWFCNDHRFISGCGIGFDGKVVQTLDRWNFPLPVGLKYWISILRNIAFYRGPKTIEGTAYLMVTVANGPTLGGGIPVSKHSDLQDGLLDIHLIKDMNLFQRLINLPKVQKGTHLKIKHVSSFQKDSFTISFHKTVEAHADGQYLESNEFVFKPAERLKWLAVKKLN